MKYFIYILKSLNFVKTYVGMTNDLERRLSEHNSGKSIYTRKFKPWKIIYTEEYGTIEEARNKEKYYKTSAGRIQLKKILCTMPR
ncbi:MAG: GIY-YIG nuclease family protein [Bacteroidetes bacterium]|nr:GIY-YIG nuclease family protein [Bacteroidota bacterium]